MKSISDQEVSPPGEPEVPRLPIDIIMAPPDGIEEVQDSIESHTGFLEEPIDDVPPTGVPMVPFDEANEVSQSYPSYSQPWLLICVGAFACFLGLINVAAGITVGEGDNWKRVFLWLYAMWTLVLCLWLYLDFRRKSPDGRMRWGLWHVAGCMASLAFFTSVLGISSDNLPQWIPLAIDCGLAASIGLQSIPSETRTQLGVYIRNIVGSLLGSTTYVTIPRSDGPQPLLPLVESSQRAVP